MSSQEPSDSPSTQPEPADPAAAPAPEDQITPDCSDHPGQQPSAFPQYDPTPPVTPKKSRAALIAGLSAVAVFVVAVVVVSTLVSDKAISKTAAANASASASASAAEAQEIASIVAEEVVPSAAAPAATQANSVNIPASVDGLAQLTDTTGQNVVAAMKKADSSGSASTLYASALFAAYSKSGSDAFYADLTLVPLTDSAALQQVYGSEGAAGALSTMGGASSYKDAQTISSPMPGSAMDCGLIEQNGSTLHSCDWIDGAEFGIDVSSPSMTMTETQSVAYAEAFEAASEGVTP